MADHFFEMREALLTQSPLDQDEVFPYGALLISLCAVSLMKHINTCTDFLSGRARSEMLDYWRLLRNKESVFRR